MMLNERQNKFAKDLQGIHLVYAGPGTGKTETIKERYRNIVSLKGIDPLKVLVVTFTDNAAESMKKRIINSLGGSAKGETQKLSELVNAPIKTFHSFCFELIRQYAFDVPDHIGIKEVITDNCSVIESETVESEIFIEFRKQFLKRHAKYKDFFKVKNSDKDLFALIKKLSCKGIIPVKKNGKRTWFGCGIDYLLGDINTFNERLDSFYSLGNKKNLASRLKAKFQKSSYFENIDILSLIEGQRLKETKLTEAFNEERVILFDFIHDLYIEYIDHLLTLNRINYEFIIMFAFLLLSFKDDLRKDLQFEYIMIDEFQDTNEMQFKIALLLSRSGNIAVVGDWKQGIYGFRYASIDNILKFEMRLKKYKEELNPDVTRIAYDVSHVTRHFFDINYRSTEKIIDLFNKTLFLPASKDELFVLAKDTEQLKSFDKTKKTEVFRLKGDTKEKEMLMILSKIRELITSKKYKVLDGAAERSIRPNDIAILMRSRGFALRLQELAIAKMPDVSYRFEAGIELYRTVPSVVILAWLRIITGKDKERSYSVILEKEGYDALSIKEIIDSKKDIDKEIINFKEELLHITDFRKLLGRIISRYNYLDEDFNNSVTDNLINDLSGIFDSSPFDVEKIISYMEKSVEERSLVEIERGAGEGCVTLQTIHAAKGLEYPVVFIADINDRNFPSQISDKFSYYYDDVNGLRMSKESLVKDNKTFVFDRWQYDLIKAATIRSYDEERRLFYVAASRAKQYLYLTSSRPSPFFEPDTDFDFPEKLLELNIVLEKIESEEKQEKEIFKIPQVSHDIPYMIPVHQLMDFKSADSGGRGIEFGKKIHDFAAKLINGVDVIPENDDEKNIVLFIKTIVGEKQAEMECTCPYFIGERKLVIRGIIDLISVSEKFVDIVDYKTDKNRKNHSEYEKQVSIYCHVAKEVYKNKKIRGSIFYTYNNENVEINIKKIDEIIDDKKDDFGF